MPQKPTLESIPETDTASGVVKKPASAPPAASTPLYRKATSTPAPVLMAALALPIPPLALPILPHQPHEERGCGVCCHGSHVTLSRQAADIIPYRVGGLNQGRRVCCFPLTSVTTRLCHFIFRKMKWQSREPQAFTLYDGTSCGLTVRNIRRNVSEASLLAVGVESKDGQGDKCGELLRCAPNPLWQTENYNTHASHRITR